MALKSLHQQLLSQGYETIYCAPSFEEYMHHINSDSGLLNNCNGGEGPDYVSANGRMATHGEELVLDGYYILYRKKRD